MLEAASELGEIGAGIQMTPNVARLLVRWGVAEVIGADLVSFGRLNMRTKDGRVVGTTATPAPGTAEKLAGAPWWLVHRRHLHDGLVCVARRRGVELVTGARVVAIEHEGHDDDDDDDKVRVRDEAGREWAFDLVVGADGLKSVTRRTILPAVRPTAPTNNAAYRAMVPMDMVRSDPLTRELVEPPAMDIWMGAAEGQEHGYVITYPISGGSVFNMVLSHHRRDPVTDVEDATLDEVRETYRDFDPRLRRIIDMIGADGGGGGGGGCSIRRWPLLVTRCTETWSSPRRNVVLMGDAAHSMVNHLAQGAATSMEDGAFLGVVLREVARGAVALGDAVAAYEAARMPLADRKQQASFLMGLVYHAEDGGPEQAARDRAMEGELRGEQLVRSPNLNADPDLWRNVFGESRGLNYEMSK